MLALSTRPLLTLGLILLALPQLLLLRFLGFGLPAQAFAAAALTLVTAGSVRALAPAAIPLRRLALLGAVALTLCLLGGEGRLFYANPDWQVRDAVLRDLVTYPWPWAYAGPEPLVLRLPSAMYLLPALVGKAGGFHAAEIALLIQNAALLTALLALGSTLFATRRARELAAVIAIGLSGMDLIGAAIAGVRLSGHLEWWTITQYSSHLTMLFWVPQHGLAGWTAALLYLLWHQRRIALVGALAPLPLLALWSPLALIGVLPFAAHAGIATLARRGLRPIDIALPALACAVALPGLLYLAAGSSSVGSRPAPLPFAVWALFVGLEVLPFLLALGATRAGMRFGGITLALVAATLLVVPFIQIGQSADFAMRASMPALAILAVMLADLLARNGATREYRLWQGIAAFALAIGFVTPLNELRRALTFPTAPPPLCSYLGVVPGGADTYVAPLARLPDWIRPTAPAMIVPHDPPRCWARDWPTP
ncbi:hypothetical protein [Sphingomonas jatrophae]|uniref:hypothetical protein n=1 Tax=Sphingomonas jatrophae TaxID=1166337 RepID=UPI000B805E16|nr:hypothetical protein [Sphingomonas jatrophae]